MHAGMHTHNHTNMYKHAGRQVGGQCGRQAGMHDRRYTHAYRHAYIHADTNAGGRNIRTQRNIGTHTGIHSYMHGLIQHYMQVGKSTHRHSCDTHTTGYTQTYILADNNTYTHTHNHDGMQQMHAYINTTHTCMHT